MMKVALHTFARNHELCLAPQPEVNKASFEIPANSCDTHAHVIGDGEVYPYVAERSYTPPPATEDAYLGMLDSCGMDRGVLIQVSVHGQDNSYMLSVLAKHSERLRGVVVLADNVSDDELEAMHRIGVRGIRFNLLFAGGPGLDALEILCRRVAPLGWHAEFLIDARDLSQLMPRLERLKITAVIDHMGHTPVMDGLGSEGFRALRTCVRDLGWWVKLSGPYRVSDRFDTEFDDVTPWVRALLDIAPDRLVWGSDWPHVAIPRMPNTGDLRNLLKRWIPDQELRKHVLVDNAARLYDFPIN